MDSREPYEEEEWEYYDEYAYDDSHPCDNCPAEECSTCIFQEDEE